MSTSLMSNRETLFRKQFVIPLFRWSLQLRFALSSASVRQQRRSHRAAPPIDVPDHLRIDVGLPSIERRHFWWTLR